MDRIYALYDLVAESIVGQMFTMKSDGPAVRAFQDTLLNPEHTISKYKKDYVLICFGTIEKDVLVPFPTPQVVITGEAIEALQVATANRAAGEVKLVS